MHEKCVIPSAESQNWWRSVIIDYT